MTEYAYKRIRISPQKTRDEHRIVMEAHIGRSLEKHEVVHHKNGNGKDNRLENLEIMTLAQHCRTHQMGIRLPVDTRNKISAALKGRKPVNTRLNPEQVIEIRFLITKGLQNKFIAKQFDVSPGIIKSIKYGKRYADIF